MGIDRVVGGDNVNCTTIMAVQIDDRTVDAPRFQEIITNHGCLIKTRLGVHQIDNCANSGLILLQLCGNDDQITAVGNEINSISNAKAKWMKLDF